LKSFATFEFEAKIRLERDGTTESSAKTPLVIDVLSTTLCSCDSENLFAQVAKGENDSERSLLRDITLLNNMCQHLFAMFNAG
jgi:hypothetical protein